MGYDKPDLAFVIHFQSPGLADRLLPAGGPGRARRSSGRTACCSSATRTATSRTTSSRPRSRAATRPRRSCGSSRRGDEFVRAARAGAAREHPPQPAADDAEDARGRGRASRRVTATVAAHGDGVDVRRRPHRGGHRGTPARAAGDARLHPRAGCLMTFLRHELDDPVTEPCGRCVRCTGVSVGVAPDGEMVARARAFLRSRSVNIEPRKQGVPAGERAEVGRALALLGDGEWGGVVTADRAAGHYRDELVGGVGPARAGLVTRAGAGVGHVRAVAAVARAGAVARGAVGRRARAAVPAGRAQDARDGPAGRDAERPTAAGQRRRRVRGRRRGADRPGPARRRPRRLAVDPDRGRRGAPAGRERDSSTRSSWPARTATESPSSPIPFFLLDPEQRYA